jgi:hypothetical protein
VFTIGNCAVSWKAVLQPVVEAEYMAIAEACKELIWLKGLHAELCGVDSCINLFLIVKVQFILLKIRCSMLGQSTLRSSTIIFEMRSKRVS